MNIDSLTLAAKTVLLVDKDERTCESRAKVLRSLGILVDCATTTKSALARYHEGSYSLVLIDAGRDVAEGEALAREIRRRKPRQRVGFLVGSPSFVASSPRSKPCNSALAPAPQALTPPAPMDFGQRVRQAEAAQRAASERKQVKRVS